MKHSRLAGLIYLGLISTSVSHTALAADVALPTVYGRFNVALEQRDTESVGTDQWELNSHASRLGVKGSADLGDSGFTLIYQAEYETNADDGADGTVNATVDTAVPATVAVKSSPAPFSQRNTFVGLKGNFGQVIAGKSDTPLKLSEGKVDQFNDINADIDALIGGQNRANNIIHYSSPKLAENIVLNAAFIPGEGTDVDADTKPDDGLADSISLSAVYDDKTFYAALAIDQNQAARRSVDGISRGDLVRLVGGWKKDSFELGALIQQTTDAISGSDKEDSSYLLSGAYTQDAFKYKVQFAQSKGDLADDKRTLTALGVDYSLASKTTLYTYLSSLKADTADTTDSTLGIGLAHSF